MEQRFVGLILALLSNICIGISFIITRQGLLSSDGHGKESYSYLRSPLWWTGTSLMVLGELANFAAYSFSSAMLVTPLGALSVIVSAILASFLLNEKLKPEGKVGCALCIIGAVMIILHSPEEKPVESVNEILSLAIQPGFVLYSLFVTIAAGYLIFALAPKYGRRTVLVYITICSLIGSITVMMCKGFGIALRLTIQGSNQLIYPSTYFFALVSGSCILIQLNYFNKALDTFSTAVVTPIYYVFFTTFTILASVSLFQGFDGSDPHQVISALGGFFVIFLGVFLLCSPISPNSARASKYLHPVAENEDSPRNLFPQESEGLIVKDSPVFDLGMKSSRIVDEP